MKRKREAAIVCPRLLMAKIVLNKAKQNKLTVTKDEDERDVLLH